MRAIGLGDPARLTYALGFLRQELLAAVARVAGAILQDRVLGGALTVRHGGDGSLGGTAGVEEIVVFRSGGRTGGR